MVCPQLIATKASYFDAAAGIAGYCSVENQPALGAMALCLEKLHSSYPKSRKIFFDACRRAGSTLLALDYVAALNNATEFLQLDSPGTVALETRAKPQAPVKPRAYGPVDFTHAEVAAAWKALETMLLNYNYGHFFGIALIGYWFFVMLVAGCCNLLYFAAPQYVKRMSGKILNRFRQYVTLPALGGRSHNNGYIVARLFPVHFPTRLESILILGFWVLVVIFLSVHVTGVSPNFVLPNKHAEMGRKVADRGAVILVYLLPPNILFAGRNNFMMWLTNWPQSRFINIHKHVSRLIFLMVLLHAVGMTYNGLGMGRYHLRNALPFIRWGYVAVVASSVMVVHSLRMVRRNNYELFLLAHILLGVIFIMSGWIHARTASYEHWFIAATVVWAFDRAMRLYRLARCGVRDAQVRLVAGETLDVAMECPALFKPYPGCIGYIYFFRATCFWQLHPFTLIYQEDTNTLKLKIKVKGGMTHGLYRYLAQQPHQTATIKAAIEGPYGAVSSAYKFDNVAFFAGGNGVPGLYYQAMDIIRKNENKCIKFFWVIRHYKSLEWFEHELRQFQGSGVRPTVFVTQPEPEIAGAQSREEKLGVRSSELHEVEGDEIIEVTRDEKLQARSHEDSPEQISDKEIDELNFDGLDSGSGTGSRKMEMNIQQRLSGIVDFVEERPDVYLRVRHEIRSSTGLIAIVTCAHPAMVDDARKAVAESLDQTRHRVELYEEMQDW